MAHGIVWHKRELKKTDLMTKDDDRMHETFRRSSCLEIQS